MKETQKTLYGGCSRSCIGYCLKHHAGVTVKQIKNKRCLEKTCYHFRRYKDHPFWDGQAARKQLRKERKQLLSRTNRELEGKEND